MNPLEPYEDERLGHFKYYKLADSIPICFLVDKEGYRYGALVPGSTRGSLERDATKLSKFDKDTHEFDSIDMMEFLQLVRDYVRPPPVGELSEETKAAYRAYLEGLRARGN